jgi:hypothetical protein
MSQFRFGIQAAAARRIEEEEAERQLTLRSTVRNDPQLFTKTKIRCLVPFYVGGGKALEKGEVATLEAHVARDMIFLGKAEAC